MNIIVGVLLLLAAYFHYKDFKDPRRLLNKTIFGLRVLELNSLVLFMIFATWGGALLIHG